MNTEELLKNCINALSENEKKDEICIIENCNHAIFKVLNTEDNYDIFSISNSEVSQFENFQLIESRLKLLEVNKKIIKLKPRLIIQLLNMKK